VSHLKITNFAFKQVGQPIPWVSAYALQIEIVVILLLRCEKVRHTCGTPGSDNAPQILAGLPGLIPPAQVGIAVAVGTTIADRPPHRSVRARLRIRLLPKMSSGKVCLLHTVQSLGHAFSALCRAHVRLNDCPWCHCSLAANVRVTRF
jgi:hypothetical protein